MHPYLFPGLRASLVAFDDLVKRIPADKWDAPTHADRFTPREVMAHLADWDPIFLERMKRTYEQPGCTILGMDEVQRAQDMNYATWDPADSMAKLRANREELIAFLKGLSQEDFQIEGIHTEKGPLKLEDHANMMLGHDLYHIEQLLAVV